MKGVHEERRKNNRFLYGFIEARLREVGLLGGSGEEEKDQRLGDDDDAREASASASIPEENVAKLIIPNSPAVSVGRLFRWARSRLLFFSSPVSSLCFFKRPRETDTKKETHLPSSRFLYPY